ncbi:hypothetical protein HK405_009174, partial [Cladochytrium tenue]
FQFEVRAAPFHFKGDSQEKDQQPTDRDSTSTLVAAVVAPGQQHPDLPFDVTLTSTTSRSFRLLRAETCLVVRLRHRQAAAGWSSPSTTSALVTTFVRVNHTAASAFELSANGPPRSAHTFTLRARIDPALSPDVLPPAAPHNLGWGLDWGLEHAVEVAVIYKEAVGIVPQKAVFRFPIRVVEGCMAACAKDTVRWYSSLPIPPGWPGHSEVAVEEYKKQYSEFLTALSSGSPSIAYAAFGASSTMSPPTSPVMSQQQISSPTASASSFVASLNRPRSNGGGGNPVAPPRNTSFGAQIPTAANTAAVSMAAPAPLGSPLLSSRPSSLVSIEQSASAFGGTTLVESRGGAASFMENPVHSSSDGWSAPGGSDGTIPSDPLSTSFLVAPLPTVGAGAAVTGAFGTGHWPPQAKRADDVRTIASTRSEASSSDNNPETTRDATVLPRTATIMTVITISESPANPAAKASQPPAANAAAAESGQQAPLPPPYLARGAAAAGDSGRPSTVLERAVGRRWTVDRFSTVAMRNSSVATTLTSERFSIRVAVDGEDPLDPDPATATAAGAAAPAKPRRRGAAWDEFHDYVLAAIERLRHDAADAAAVAAVTDPASPRSDGALPTLDEDDEEEYAADNVDAPPPPPPPLPPLPDPTLPRVLSPSSSPGLRAAAALPSHPHPLAASEPSSPRLHAAHDLPVFSPTPGHSAAGFSHRSASDFYTSSASLPRPAVTGKAPSGGGGGGLPIFSATPSLDDPATSPSASPAPLPARTAPPRTISRDAAAAAVHLARAKSSATAVRPAVTAASESGGSLPRPGAAAAAAAAGYAATGPFSVDGQAGIACIALRACSAAAAPNAIDVWPGDRVVVRTRLPNGWVYGTNSTTGAAGLFPELAVAPLVPSM